MTVKQGLAASSDAQEIRVLTCLCVYFRLCKGLIFPNKNVNLFKIVVDSFFKDFVYLLLERGEGKEKERERNVSVWLPLMRPLLGNWPATQACALTGNRTGNTLVLRLALNPLSHTSQGCRWFLRTNNFLTIGM